MAPKNTSSGKKEPGESLQTACLPDTPLGPLAISVSCVGLARIEFLAPLSGSQENSVSEDTASMSDSASLAATPMLMIVMEQIRDYLDGRRQSFDLPIDWSRITSFQEQVLRFALTIPYGQTRTYGDLAIEIGQPGASRAVGVALGKNPLPIVIPCHRVLGSGGRLQGYSAPDGLNKKTWLLKLEGVLLFG